MSISQVLTILWRRGWIALQTFICALAVAIAILEFAPARYDAVATASIDPGGIDPITRLQGGQTPVDLMQGNLLALVTSQRTAINVVKRLNLTATPEVQSDYRRSKSFGHESIQDWYASTLVSNVVPTFAFGTNVLTIKYKSTDPYQAAKLANAFLAATIDETIAMKAESAEQVAHWFTPQLDELRNEVEAARARVQEFESQTNLPAAGEDPSTAHLMTVTQNLSNARANLTFLQSRLTSDSDELAGDAADPDLQELNTLKAKMSDLATTVAATKSALGVHNPKVASLQSMVDSIGKQIPEVRDRALKKVREHLKQRVAQTEQVIASLEAELAASQKTAIADQGKRDQLRQLQRDVEFRAGQLNAQERMAEQEKLQSKMTLADVTVLDKAVPPASPAFPKPLQVMVLAVGAGFTLGLILALFAEMTDRRIRSPEDLEFVTSAPLLGTIYISKRGSGYREPFLIR